MKVDSLITIGRDELSRAQWERLMLKLTFTDADDNEVNAFQYVSGRQQMLVPRGVWDMLPDNLALTDMRSLPLMPKVAYQRELDAKGYDGQEKAVRAMFKQQQGQVIAPPGRGKTEICLAFAASSKTRVLVVVHTHDLFKQWIERAGVAVPGMKLGTIQGKTCDVQHLTIATAQTLKRYLHEGGKFWRQFGAIIIDEAHHAAASTWEWLLNVCPAFYRFGVTASQKRSDGRQPLVRFNIGPVISKMEFKSGVPMTVLPIQTRFHTKYNGQQYTRVIHEVVRDEARNRLIANLVLKEIHEGNSVLVLSRQILHLELIYEAMCQIPDLNEVMLKGQAQIVTGQIPKGKRAKYIAALTDGSLRCILGTQLFEEGVDIPRLNRIVLAYPGTEITALQKVGRGSRAFEGKTETLIYDLLDDLVRVLAKQYLRRRTWYKSVGLTVEKVRQYDKAKGRKDNGRTEDSQGRKRDRVFQVARPRRA